MPFSSGLTIPRLSDIEPFLDQKMSSSYYTNVYVLRDTPYGEVVVKRNRVGDNDGASFKALFSEIKEFREALIRLGIPVSKWLFADIQEEEDGWHYYIVERYAGHGFKEEVAQMGLKPTIHQLFERVMIPLFKDADSEYLNFGIDTPLRNFVFSATSGVTYVDLFPPRVRQGDQMLLEYPDPTDHDSVFIGRFNKYLCKGVFYTLFINLCREYPTKRSEILDLFHGLATEIGHPEYLDTIMQSPASSILDLPLEEAVSLIKGFSVRFEGYFHFRDMAFALASRHEGLAAKIPEICHLTHPHQDTDYFLDPLEVSKAKNYLIESLHEIKMRPRMVIER